MQAFAPSVPSRSLLTTYQRDFCVKGHGILKNGLSDVLDKDHAEEELKFQDMNKSGYTTITDVIDALQKEVGGRIRVLHEPAAVVHYTYVLLAFDSFDSFPIRSVPLHSTDTTVRVDFLHPAMRERYKRVTEQALIKFEYSTNPCCEYEWIGVVFLGLRHMGRFGRSHHHMLVGKEKGTDNVFLINPNGEPHEVVARILRVTQLLGQFSVQHLLTRVGGCGPACVIVADRLAAGPNKFPSTALSIVYQRIQVIAHIVVSHASYITRKTGVTTPLQGF